MSIGVLPNVNSIKIESGCKAVDMCLFPHHKVDEQLTKSGKRTPLPKREEKATTEMQCLLCKLYLSWVVSRKTQSYWILKYANKPETRCKKSWDRFEEYGSLSPRYVKQVSGKRKYPHSEKCKSKFLLSEVPTLWNLRTGPKKRLNDNSDAPEARHGTLPKTFSSSKTKTSLHSTRPQKNRYSLLCQQKSRRKESLW